MPMKDEESKSELSGAQGAGGGSAGKGVTSTERSTSGRNSEADDSTEQKAADAVALLKADHRKVEQLFQEYEKASNRQKKKSIVEQIAHEFLTHSLIEEQLFYPACREKIEDDMLDEAQVEHDSAKLLVTELLNSSPTADYYDAKVTVLKEYIKHHVGEEEQAGSGIFDKAKKAGVDMNALGASIGQNREKIARQVQDGHPDMPSLSIQKKGQTQENDMRQRDYDDNRNSRPSSRYRDEDDRGYRGRSMPERDEQGRFMSDDDRSGRHLDEYARSGRYGGRDDGGRDDRGRFSNGGRDHGQGGWFGDPEGHSDASRRGWENREGGSRGYGRDDDDYRGGSRSSRGGYRDDDDRGYNRDRGQGGWFGDPEGHSEASRRGWESREGGSRGGYGRDDDDYRGSARSSRGGYRDDDDRGYSRDHGQGGWFGDPEGHSEASRRGWRNR